MRLIPLAADDWNDEVVQALSVMMPPERARPELVGNMLGTFARHPRLTRAYLTFTMHLLMSSTLPKRLVEIIVLRTAVCRGSDYLWEHHLSLAARAGLTEDDIDGIRAGALSDPLDSAVLSAVDELHRDTMVSDMTWCAAGRQLSDQQLMDLVFTAGCYGTLAMAIRSFGVADD